MTIRSITHVLVLVLSARVLIAQNPPARFRSGVDAVRVSEEGVREGAILVAAHAGRGWRDRLVTLAAGWA